MIVPAPALEARGGDAERPRGESTWRVVDWRYVLPVAHGAVDRIVVVAGGREESERILEAKLACRVMPVLPAGSSVDAVVLHAGASVSLRDVARSLTPGGVLYYEVDRRTCRSWRLSPDRVEKQMRHAGLTPTGLYWVTPSFRRPRWYLPLDVDGALIWYMSHLLLASTLRQRLIKDGLGALSTLGARRFASLVPCYAVTAVRGPSDNELASVLNGDGVPQHVRQRTVRPLVLLGGENDFNRVVLLPFAKESRRPLVVLKVGRVPYPVNGRIEREQAVLRQLSRLGAGVRASVPTPLATSRWGPLTVGIESCVEGRLLATSLEGLGVRRAAKIRELRLVVSWLTDFHRQGDTGAPLWTEQSLESWVTAPTAEYAATVGATDGERRLFEAIRNRAASLIGQRMPVVWLHWGFMSRNIYRTTDRVSVVDWEGGSPGPGLLDLLYFVLHWYSAVERLHSSERVNGLARLYIEPRHRRRATVTVARESVVGYLDALRIDRRFLAPMLGIMCVMRALGQLRLASTDRHVDDKEAARARNIYVQYIARLAVEADRFFSIDTF